MFCMIFSVEISIQIGAYWSGTYSTHDHYTSRACMMNAVHQSAKMRIIS